MKRIAVVLVMLACALGVEATIVTFTDAGYSTLTTGDRLDDIGTNFTQVSVLEIQGLNLSIATATAGHKLNANSNDFGITPDLNVELNSAFDVGEAALMFFDQDIQITKIEFSKFDNSETFNFTIGTAKEEISWFDLSGEGNRFYNDIIWNVSAREIIRMEVAGDFDSISMNALDITVVPEPAIMAMFWIGGVIILIIRRFVRIF